jgi:hypothetical protein
VKQSDDARSLSRPRNRTGRASALVAAVLLTGLGQAPASAASRSDIDRDGVQDRTDNCIVVPNSNQQDGNRNAVGDACDGANASKTVAQLRAIPLASLNAVMAVTKPGRMPTYGSEAKGYVRWMPDTSLDPVLQKVFMQAWQGKIWYTRSDGGYLVNRMVADVEVHYHKVHFGTSPADGRPAIIVEPGFPVDQFYDMIRFVQPGIYLGYSMLSERYGIKLPANTRMLSFILDFNDPTIRPEECLQCQLGLAKLGIQVTWPLGPKNPLGLSRPVG